MVKLCDTTYPINSESQYDSYYEKYPYSLHDFQKWSIEAIVTGNDLLVCCPTGSGKTFSGEFALDYFHSKGKKTIYTSPIKALSNEKYYNFTAKYPHISIGLITGDIKINPDADVLIMTTEILLNKLYQIKSTEKNIVARTSISFDMDIESELRCVIFDEIHMINDENRGTVWEQCIMMLPNYVQLVGLSATLDNPVKFAEWLQNKGDILNDDSLSTEANKEVYLTQKFKRAVPLIHYSYTITNASIFKKVKDKALQEEIKRLTKMPMVLQDASGKFNEDNYNNMNKMLKLFDKHHVFVKRQHVLNKVCEHLVEHEMLPALCYVFSRKQLEKCASELTTNLLEFDSKVPYTIDYECEQIVRKLPNYQEYLNLPEYISTVQLLRKGIGIHHAGLMPILREMTEMLFSKGYVKVLFCTETMSVGINLPVKTTIFTNIYKYNGQHNRLLLGHEYTQAAGRAGRLGLDTVGHVIHLNNLFNETGKTEYKNMIKGAPQRLSSKFKISYNLLLNLIDIGTHDFIKFVNKSMITGDINNHIKSLSNEMKDITIQINENKKKLQYLNTPLEVIKEYDSLNSTRLNFVNKKRKQVDRNIQLIKENHKNLEKDKKNYDNILLKEKDLVKLEVELANVGSFIENGILDIFKLLIRDQFIEQNHENENTYCLTFKGKMAVNLKESHCLLFGELMESNLFQFLSTEEIVCYLSCFTNITVRDELNSINPDNNDNSKKLSNVIQFTQEKYDEYQKEEFHYNFKTGIDYNLQYNLVSYMKQWCACGSENDCKLFLQMIKEEKDIFLGEFVKALLKINNIAEELKTVCELTSNIELLSKINKISEKTLKFVVTNQSLYI